jgi:hypothetical protein
MDSLPDLAIKPWLTQSHESFVLINATVIDSANGRLLPGPRAVVVANGAIFSVEPMAAATLGDMVQHDVTGKFVCPGLIDAHVHVTAVPGVEVCLKTKLGLTLTVDNGRHGPPPRTNGHPALDLHPARDAAAGLHDCAGHGRGDQGARGGD